jgi:co-chaperonin GroES (HSP10)
MKVTTPHPRNQRDDRIAPRSASPKWAGRARRFKIEGLKYPIMKESDIMGALVEAEERTKVA